jgi:hypothetical protein
LTAAKSINWKRYLYIGDRLHKIRLINNKINRCPVPKDFVKLHTADKEDAVKVQKDCMTRLVSPAAGDNYIADAMLIESKFTVNQDDDMINILVAPVKTQIKDNDYINDYISNTFQEYAAFIKQWMAVYAFTNHRRLPLLVLGGATSSGKSTFAEFLGELYPTLSMQWNGKQENFSPQSEQKLLIIDENEGTGSVKQYKALKHYLGAEWLTVNLKYRQAYVVRNNINLVVASNAAIPIFVQPEEMDENPARNKFFVYEFTRPDKVNANIKYELQERIGYYIKTELKEIYEAIRADMPKYRFAVPVPVTEELRGLSTANESTDVTLFVELIYHIVQSGYSGVDRTELIDRHIVTNRALRAAYKSYADANLPESAFKSWHYRLRDEKLIENSTLYKVNGAPARGYKLNWPMFSKKFCDGVDNISDMVVSFNADQQNTVGF